MITYTLYWSISTAHHYHLINTRIEIQYFWNICLNYDEVVLYYFPDFDSMTIGKDVSSSFQSLSILQRMKL